MASRPTLKLKRTAPVVPAEPETPPTGPAAALQLFRERYAVFRDCRPLKIGVHRDLRALHPEFSHRTVARAVGRWVKRRSYLSALADGVTRFDLHGNPDGVVTAEQQQVARRRIGAAA